MLRAALEIHGVPRRDWPMFAAGTRFLFALERDLVDVDAFAGPDEGEEVGDARSGW